MNDGYLTRILSYDPLSPEENNRLAMLAQEGNAQARDLVVLSNSRLVKQLLSKYNCSEFERDDLMQEGLCGILKAIDTYDETKSAFSTLCLLLDSGNDSERYTNYGRFSL